MRKRAGGRAASLLAACAHAVAPKRFVDVRDRQRLALAGLAVLDLDLAGGHAARTDDHLPRQADQVGRGELAARPLVGVVVEHVLAGSDECCIEFAADAVAFGVADLHVDQADVERRDRFRPDDAVVVMAGLDDRSDQPRRANAVGAHRDEMILAVGPGHLGAHRLRVFVAEMEDVADLDAARRDTVALGDRRPTPPRHASRRLRHRASSTS